MSSSVSSAVIARLVAAVLLFNAGPASMPVQAQVSTDAEPLPVTEELAPVIRTLFAAIEALSSYRAVGPLPAVYQLPQYRLEEKVCDEPCNVRAAYLPREGIYLSANLDAARDPRDRAALLHELVHYLQQGHPKFADMDPCERERAKEQEAYAIQNAYLATIDSRDRAVFYDDFDCDGVESAPPR